MAIVSSAGLPKASHASQRSRKKSSLSLLREPRGRPLGLPDWPGFQGINPRCLCFRSVESLSAASAFDIGPIKPTSSLVSLKVYISVQISTLEWDRFRRSHHAPWMIRLVTERLHGLLSFISKPLPRGQAP